METKKLERIIIIILALLNVFLLVVVLTGKRQERISRRDTTEMLTALLGEHGVTVGPDVALLQDCPAQCTVARDLDLEQRRIQSILGNHSSEDLGGSIWFYASENGQIRMRGTGEIDMLLSGAGTLRGRSPAKAAEALFSGAEVTLVKTEETENSLTYCCSWDGFSVYNAILNMDYTRERISMISGTIVFNVETETDAAAGMDSASALVRFMDLMREGELSCSRLDSLTPGYYLSVTISGESTLTPVWRFATDVRDYYINAVSGRIENIG